MNQQPTVEQQVARLSAMEDIKQLKVRYWRCVDSKDQAGLESIFTEDAYFDARNSSRNGNDKNSESQMLGDDWVWRGNKAIAAAIYQRVAPIVTVHHGHMPEIEILSETTARAVWPFEDIIATRRPVGNDLITMKGYGYYHETYRRVNGAWRIATSLITRLHTELYE